MRSNLCYLLQSLYSDPRVSLQPCTVPFSLTILDFSHRYMEAGLLTSLSLSVVQDGIDTQYVDWLSDLAVLIFFLNASIS